MSRKRSAEESVESLKYTRIKLASPSPERSSESDTESIHSYEGYTTEPVKDTSDTSSSPSHLNNIEFEVTDIEEAKFYYYLSEDSYDVNDAHFDFAKFSTANDSLSDDALLGDKSEENSTSPTSNSDCDPGLPRNDFLDFEHCLLCKTDKKDISYPYCTVCFNWKKNFFPPRPKRFKKKFKKEGNVLKEPEKENGNESKAMDRNGSLGDELGEDSGVRSPEAQLSKDIVDRPSTSRADSNSSTEKLCKVCFCKPENGLFVHLKVAHLYGCYNCATKIWYNSGSCPICRRKVFKITKLL